LKLIIILFLKGLIFVDDYRIFAKDAITAHHCLSLLVERLNKEGLFLNINKTKVEDVSSSYPESSEMKGTEEDKEIVTALEMPIQQSQEFSSEELDLKFNFPKVIRGYSGLIPMKFRRLSDSEKGKLIKEDENQLLSHLKSQILIEPEETKKLIKIIAAKESFEIMSEVPDILEKFPQFLPYFTDVVTRYQDNISEITCEKIKTALSRWFEKENMPEYILVYLTRFFKEIKFEDKDILLRYFRNLKRNAGNYIGRALLEALENKISRGEMLEIRDYYVRADLWEKRQIIKMVGKILSEGEKRPFFKDVSMHSSDLMIEFIVKKYSKVSNKLDKTS
jgi:hypothetical protein